MARRASSIYDETYKRNRVGDTDRGAFTYANTLWMTQPLLLHARPLGASPSEPQTTHPHLVDHLHASEKLATLSGALAWQAQESAFGATTPAPSATAENPLRFSSQYFDPESAQSAGAVGEPCWWGKPDRGAGLGQAETASCPGKWFFLTPVRR